MKKILLLALLAITVTTQSQIKLLGQTTKKQERNFYVTSSLLFVSGMADGLAEASKFHPKGVTEVFGNPQFWDNSLSWRNKYRNGDPAQGAKFPFSTTALAEAVIYYLTYTLGFTLSYDIIFDN